MRWYVNDPYVSHRSEGTMLNRYRALPSPLNNGKSGDFKNWGFESPLADKLNKEKQNERPDKTRRS